ncbi:MAG: GrpB family protein [Nocardioides sp.]|nr:GrpB family protein [Nocardioides sp.]
MADARDAGPAGLPRGALELHPYDPLWPVQFEHEKALLLGELGDRLLSVKHVGGTSVPGLAAKPLIDILAEVATIDGPTASRWRSPAPRTARTRRFRDRPVPTTLSETSMRTA